MEKKYLVKFKTAHQISEYDFDVFYQEKLFAEDSTIKDICEWMKTAFWRGDKNKFKLREVLLSEPE